MVNELAIEGQGLGEAEAPEVEKPLSIEEEVTKVYDELSLKEAEDDDSEEVSDEVEAKEPEEPQEEEKAEKPERKKKRTTYEMGGGLDAPSDWNAEAKEQFAKWPKEAQQEISRISRDYQSYRSKQITVDRQREEVFNREYNRIKGVASVVEEFLPIWGSAGKSSTAAMSEICSFLTNLKKDPDVEIERLAKTYGREITIHNRQGSTNGIAQQPNFRYEDVYGRLKQDFAREQQEISYRRDFEALKHQATVTLNKLQAETDGSGKFIYPDLHSPEFHAQMEPIAGAIARANPTLSQEEIILRSYKAANGRVLPRKAPSQAATLSNGYSRTTYARRAANSVPGSVGISPNPSLEAKRDETMEQYVARIYNSFDT